MTAALSAGTIHFVRCWVDGGVLERNPSPRGIYWSVRVEPGLGEPAISLRRRWDAKKRGPQDAPPFPLPKRGNKLWTNNEAEWAALRDALVYLVEMKVRQPIVIYSDSRLIVNQFNERFACNFEWIIKIRAECKELAGQLRNVIVSWCPRETNVRKLGH